MPAFKDGLPKMRWATWQHKICLEDFNSMPARTARTPALRVGGPRRTCQSMQPSPRRNDETHVMTRMPRNNPTANDIRGSRSIAQKNENESKEQAPLIDMKNIRNLGTTTRHAELFSWARGQTGILATRCVLERCLNLGYPGDGGSGLSSLRFRVH